MVGRMMVAVVSIHGGGSPGWGQKRDGKSGDPDDDGGQKKFFSVGAGS